MPQVRAELGQGTLVLLTARNHTWNADEPVEARGTDEGPTPYELLLGALGACTTLTLRLYAERKGWPLEAVKVDYEFTREHGRDCDECEADDDARLEVIRAKVLIRGNLNDEQRERLREIVTRCPVHRTLETGPELFETVEFESAPESPGAG
jgi:putative redox protein